MIRYEKRLLLEKDIFNYYSWVCSSVFDRVATVSPK
jgi:hypothetical protein